MDDLPSIIRSFVFPGQSSERPLYKLYNLNFGYANNPLNIDDSSAAVGYGDSATIIAGPSGGGWREVAGVCVCVCMCVCADRF